MKLTKLLTSLVLTISLYSCSCEDVNVGKLEFTNDLISFLPALPAKGKSYYAAGEQSKVRMNYVTPEGYTKVRVPVKKINYSGKFDLNSCIEYYEAEEKEFTGQTEGESVFSIKVKYRKDVNPQSLNNIPDKDNVNDVVEFTLGYSNKFPAPIYIGQTRYDSYTTQRFFIFKDVTTAKANKIVYTQEFLPTITLNDVQHENVYHLQLNGGYGFRPEDQYMREKYPALDYVKGFYLKEGLGVIHAYTLNGKQLDITVE